MLHNLKRILEHTPSFAAVTPPLPRQMVIWAVEEIQRLRGEVDVLRTERNAYAARAARLEKNLARFERFVGDLLDQEDGNEY